MVSSRLKEYRPGEVVALERNPSHRQADLPDLDGNDFFTSCRRMKDVQLARLWWEHPAYSEPR